MPAVYDRSLSVCGKRHSEGCSARGRRVKLRRASALHTPFQAPPGTIIQAAPTASVQSTGGRHRQARLWSRHGQYRPRGIMRIHGCQPSHGPCMPKIRPFIQDIELGGSGRAVHAAGPATKAKHTLLFSVEKTPKTPIMIRPRQFPQQANHWPPNHPPRPPGSYQPCIAALGDIICLLFEHSSTAQPPGKASLLPCLQSTPPFMTNLHILCILSAYVSAMVCV